MKKIIVSLSIILSFHTFAQDVFIDLNSKNKYLFLGSINGEQKKYIDVHDNSIKWIKNSQLKQVDRLLPQQFSKIIFHAGLTFFISGDEPFWSATINQNILSFLPPSEPSGKYKKYPIKLNTINNSVDYGFLLMFQSQDHTTYGMIRGLDINSPCEIAINDEISIFEVFINYRGEIFKGCAMLDKDQ